MRRMAGCPCLYCCCATVLRSIARTSNLSARSVLLDPAGHRLAQRSQVIGVPGVEHDVLAEDAGVRVRQLRIVRGDQSLDGFERLAGTPCGDQVSRPVSRTLWCCCRHGDSSLSQASGSVSHIRLPLRRFMNAGITCRFAAQCRPEAFFASIGTRWSMCQSTPVAARRC